jgi:NAD(P)-dependent dehydrogenase (short-subunit alcohol dehydrogenase family)
VSAAILPPALQRFDLEGRTAIVTGVGPGLGEHVAKAYAQLGANVVIAARSPDCLGRVEAEINSAGRGRALAVRADAGDRDSLKDLVDKARDAFGPIYILFNSAAAGAVVPGSDIWANAAAVWELAFRVNVMATWHLAEFTATDMEQHGKGSIIAVESCGGHTPIPPSIAYGVSKSALNFLVRSLAKARAPHTRVNGLCIGSMSVDRSESAQHQGYKLADRNAIKRFGSADEAVGAAILLASDASSYTTGSTLFVEGGRIGTVS